MSGTALTPERLALLAAIAKRTARSGRLSREDAQDFEQTVYVRLLERHDDIFERFDGRSTLSTYLQVIVTRMLHDWRTGVRGKWRPAAVSVSMGDTAVHLDRLINRDGLTRREAVQTLQAVVPLAGPGLEQLADRVPQRIRHRRVALSELDGTPWAAVCDPVSMREANEDERTRRQVLRAAVRTLPAADRRLLHARYAQGRSVKAVATDAAINPKVLYRRFDRVLRTLRHSIAPQDSPARPFAYR